MLKEAAVSLPRPPEGKCRSAPHEGTPAGVPGADDAAADEELQLPLLGMYADLEPGRGLVLLPDEFLQCSGLLQLQVIAQRQRSLSHYGRNALRLRQEEHADKAPVRP